MPGYESPRILITGLNGLIGWQIFSEARRRFPHAAGTYRKYHPSLGETGIFRLEHENAASLLRLFGEFQPDYLIYAWSMCDLDLCEQMPAMAEEINVAALAKILSTARGYGKLKKIIYISTDHVFDGERGDYTEDDIPSPKHVYGRTKLAAENLIRDCALPWIIIRPGLVIGASLQGKKGPKDFLFHRIRGGKTTHYFTDEWRTPIPAQDLAAEVFGLAVSSAQGVYHVANELRISRFDLACRLAHENGLSTERILPRLRAEDRWAHIRPKDLSLKSSRLRSSV